MADSRSVFKQGDQWANKLDGAGRASTLHDTQAAAIAEARRMLRGAGGGEMKIMGEDGRIRAKDTIPPGNDKYPPKG